MKREGRIGRRSVGGRRSMSRWVVDKGKVVGGGAVVTRLGEIMAMYGRMASCTSDLAGDQQRSLPSKRAYAHKPHEILDALQVHKIIHSGLWHARRRSRDYRPLRIDGTPVRFPLVGVDVCPCGRMRGRIRRGG